MANLFGFGFNVFGQLSRLKVKQEFEEINEESKLCKAKGCDRTDNAMITNTPYITFPMRLDWNSFNYHKRNYGRGNETTHGTKEELEDPEIQKGIEKTEPEKNCTTSLLSNDASDQQHAQLKHVAVGWDHLIFLDDEGTLSSEWKSLSEETCLDEYTSVASSWNALYLVNKQGKCFSQSADGELAPMASEISDVEFTAIAAGNTHVVAIDSESRPHLLRNDAPLCLSPISSPKFSVKSVSCGHEHVVLLSKIGIVFTFGSGSRGQLGHGNIESRSQPEVIAALEGMTMTQVSAGGWHSIALSDIGDVYTWGWNERGQLGQPSKGVRLQTTQPKSSPEKAAKIAKLDEDAKETTEGGSEMVNVQSMPVVLDVVSSDGQLLSFKDVSCGSRHSAAVSEAGNVYTWGWNDSGQLGLNDLRSRDLPTRVPHFSENVTKVHCGYWNTIVECEHCS